ncbi:MAG: signal peptidase II [Thermoleophilaceae bacterium]
MAVLLLLAGLATAALDQGTKRFATTAFSNERGSLAGLSVRQAGLAWVFAAACVASVIALAAPVPAAAALGLGLVAGGATSNLADRIGRGGVVDFIAVGRWPAFNVADAAMACGLAVAAWSLL